MPQPPEIAEAYSLIASARLDEALEICARVLALRPHDAAALQAQGIAELKKGRLARALASLKRALEQQPGDPVLLNNCGEAYRLAGQNEEAFDCFKRAIQIHGGTPLPHVNMGLVMRAMGKAREAEHFFKNALVLDPDFERAHFELAELYWEEGHVTEALERYRQALAVSPGSARTCAQLGALLASVGKTVEAKDQLAEAVRLDPLDWRARAMLARAQFELCHEAAARENYARALEDNPALSPNTEPRITVARRAEPRDWAERAGSGCWRLARAHWLGLPPPRTVPAEAARGWTAGRVTEPIAPDLFLCRIEQAQVLPRDFVVLTRDHRVLVDGLVNWAQHYAQRGRHVVHAADDGRFLLDLPRAQERLPGEVAVLGGTGDRFDWLFGAVGRLWALDQQPGATAVPVIVPAGMDAQRRGLLDALGIGEARLRLLPEDRCFQCETLYVPSIPVVGDWVSPLAIQFLRRRLLPLVAERGSAGRSEDRRIYISRAGRESRRLANETELLPLLERAGFEAVRLEPLAFMEQLALFSDARAILALDDEALAGLVVAPQGARVGVIVARGIYRPRAYFVSAQLGHDFSYLEAEPQFDSHPDHAECDVSLRPEFLAEWLSPA